MKLNIGDVGPGNPVEGQPVDDYIGFDIKRGQDARALPYESESCDEVRASHVLEHFPGVEVKAVLTEWVRVLKPGGVLKIAVPNFKMIAEQYLAGAAIPIQGYIMGGQVDADDFHKTLFDAELLTETLKAVGLIGIRTWADSIEDCSRLPISLNLAGTKPYREWPKCAAVISMPRLGFNDFWECAVSYLGRMMPVRRITGAYWDSNLTQCIEEAIAETDPDWIITADYDSVFLADQVVALLDLAARHPEADAIVPIQTARWHELPMFTAVDDNGDLISKVPRGDLIGVELMRTNTAHFGLSLLRAEKLKDLPQPWFFRKSEAPGTLRTTGQYKSIDPDVQFWHQWRAAGNSLYTALRVAIGHCDLVVRWPDINLEAIYQKPADFFKLGPPENVWK